MGIFNKTKGIKEIWREFATQLDAEFVDGGFWKGFHIEKKFDIWRINMDQFSSDKASFTRVRAPYIATREFKFDIHHKNILSALGKILGAQDIEIGNPDFDRDYIIKGNDAELVMSLFFNSAIITLIQNIQPPRQFSISSQKVKKLYGTKFPPQTYQIFYQQSGIIKEIERMKLINEIFGAILTQLHKIGVATKQDPYQSFG
ncbi:DUF3137 domain-containing protein [bacterium]|nr:DUF3137 domain-containing protein [bacterium]